jgi:thioredoxin-dependent peroxiredoxin
VSYPREGEVAPDFELPADDGTRIRLSDLRGRKVVLYFYPKDDTPGCTAQACDLRDHIAEFDTRGALVFGISADDVNSHVRFRNKFELPFRLLADTDHRVAEQYGVWKQKSMFGVKFWGIERTSFVIDEHGRVATVLPRVKAGEHLGRVLDLI